MGQWLPFMVVMALMNPLFNHQGVTVLGYLPGGNALTLEAVLYGVLASGMVASVVCWCGCLQQEMSDDKITYLFGRVAPSLGLVFSMTVRFIPRFIKRLRKVAGARRGIGQGETGTLRGRWRNALSVLSGVTTWALENAMDTADSMKARGYGLPGRTAFSIFRFDKRSMTTLGILLVLSGIVIIGGVWGKLEFRCFPFIDGAGITRQNMPVFAAYFLFCSYPLLLEFWEVKRWNSIKSKR